MKKESLLFLALIFSSAILFGQRIISGVVIDASGEALIGASVLVEETTFGTVTDIDGSYKLDIPADAKILVVNYTGYATKKIKLKKFKNTNVIDARLVEGICNLGNSNSKKALGYGATTISFNWDGSKRISTYDPLIF